MAFWYKESKKALFLAEKIKVIVKELYEFGSSQPSPSAIFYLNAVLQIDCMIHLMLGRSYNQQDLFQLLKIRKDLFSFAERKHLSTAVNLLAQPLSMRTWRVLEGMIKGDDESINLALSAYPHCKASPMSLINAINHINWIIHSGPLSDFRAAMFANNASTFLLTEMATENWSVGKHASVEFQHWFYNLMCMRHWAGDNIMATLIKDAILGKKVEIIDLFESSFPMKILSKAYSLITEDEITEILKQVPSSNLALCLFFKRRSAEEFVTLAQSFLGDSGKPKNNSEYIASLGQSFLGCNPLLSVSEKLFNVEPTFTLYSEEKINQYPNSLINDAVNRGFRHGKIVPEIENLDLVAQLIAFNKEFGNIDLPLPSSLAFESSNLSEDFPEFVKLFFSNANELFGKEHVDLKLIPGAIRQFIGQNSEDSALQIYKLYLKLYIGALRVHSVAYSWYFRLVEQHALFLSTGTNPNLFFDSLNTKFLIAKKKGVLNPSTKTAIILSSSRYIFSLMGDGIFQISLSNFILEQFPKEDKLAMLIVGSLFLYFNARGIDSSIMMGFPSERGGSLTCSNGGRFFIPIISPIEFLSRFPGKSTKDNEKDSGIQETMAYMTFSYCLFAYSCFPSPLENEKAGGNFLYGNIFKIILEQFFVHLEQKRLPVEFEIPMRASIIHLISLCVEKNQLKYLYNILENHLGNRYLVSTLTFLPTPILDALAEVEKSAELSLLASIRYGLLYLNEFKWDSFHFEALSKCYLSGDRLGHETLIAFLTRTIDHSSKSNENNLMVHDLKLMEFFDKLYFGNESEFSPYFASIFTFSNVHQKQMVLKLFCSEFKRLESSFPNFVDETLPISKPTEISLVKLNDLTVHEKEDRLKENLYQLLYSKICIDIAESKDKTPLVSVLSPLTLTELRGLDCFLRRSLAKDWPKQNKIESHLLLAEIENLIGVREGASASLETRKSNNNNSVGRKGKNDNAVDKSCLKSEVKREDNQKAPISSKENKRVVNKKLANVPPRKNLETKPVEKEINLPKNNKVKPINEKAIPTFVDSREREEKKVKPLAPLDGTHLDRYFGYRGDGLCFLKEKKFIEGEFELIKAYAKERGLPFALTEASSIDLDFTDSKRRSAWKYEKVLPEIPPKKKENKLERLLDVLRGKETTDADSLYRLRSLIKFSCARKSDNIQLSLRLSKHLSPPIQISNGALLINQDLDPENFSKLIVKLVNLKPIPTELPKKPSPPTKAIIPPLVVQESDKNNSENGNSESPNAELSAEVSSWPIVQVDNSLVVPPEQIVEEEIQNIPIPQAIVDVDYMNYSDQLSELNRKNYADKIDELRLLLVESDFIAFDLELTGFRIPGQIKGEFEDNLRAAEGNSPVQIGLMGMKQDPDVPFLKPCQIKNMKSVWKIPVALNGNTDRSIWQENSLDYLLGHNFDLEDWERNCIDHRDLIDLFKIIPEKKKKLLVHNGCLDLFHFLKLLSQDGKFPEEILNFQDDSTLSAYLKNRNILFYDSRVIHNRLYRGRKETLVQACKRIFPDLIDSELFHVASGDAFYTGHLARDGSPLVESEENVFIRMVNPPKKSRRVHNEKKSLPLPPPVNSVEVPRLSASSVEFRPNTFPHNIYPYEPPQYPNNPIYTYPQYNNYPFQYNNNYIPYQQFPPYHEMPPGYQQYIPPGNNSY